MAATSEGPKERVGLMEQPSMGSRNRCATITLIAIGNTPSGPPPAVGMSMVANTLYTSSMVPIISARNTWLPVKTVSSHEFEPKALAAGQFVPKIALYTWRHHKRKKYCLKVTIRRMLQEQNLPIGKMYNKRFAQMKPYHQQKAQKLRHN